MPRPFARDELSVQLFWRPLDSRARILVVAKDAGYRNVYFCQPLTNLKVIRDGSTLQLCRMRRESKYSLWARLNFSLYERWFPGS